MEYSFIKANDGCPLAFQTSLPLTSPDPRRRTLILLIHGFSGSSAYFGRNYASLSSDHWVVAPDLRGHGKSGRPRGGYHVARLAADLRDLVAYLRNSVIVSETADDDRGDAGPSLKIVPVGCSIGAAILWTYTELYTPRDFAAMVFVDQAPLQDRSTFDGWDVSKAHRGCFDEASMQAAQDAWTKDSANAYRGLVADCLGYRYAPEDGDDVSEERRKQDEEFFTGISAQCDPVWLARLLADHTRYDHREAIEGIDVPVMVMAGRRTGCFPLEGMRETVERVLKGFRERGSEDDAVAKWVVFETGHWLFYEEPERFHGELVKFVDAYTK